MKRRIMSIVIFFLIICTILFCFMPKDRVFAEENESDIEKELKDATEQNIEKLDLSDFEIFVNSLNEDSKELVGIESIKDFLKDISDGKVESADFSIYFKSATVYALKSFLSFMPGLLTILIISLLGGILSSISSGFMNKQTEKIIYYVCYASVVLVLLAALVPVVESTKSAIIMIKNFSEIVFPLLLTIMIALGAATSAGVYNPLMAVFSSGIISVISGVVLPCFIASTVFSIVGNVTSSVKLTKMTAFFKSAAEWLLGIVFSLFTVFVTFKGIVGASIDSVSVNAAKFAISSYVPVLGGYLSQGFDIVLASVVIIKNAVGLTGILILIAVMIFPLIKIIIFILGLKLTAALSEPFGDGKISEMLSSVSKSATLLVSSLIGVGFVFMILIMLVICSCNAGVV